MALRFGALFHDVAKPETRGQRPDGRITFIGHDLLGQEMVSAVFRRLRASERLRAYVGKVTREHLTLGFLVHERPLDRRALHAYLRT
jgi:putative nucleotidyltransferase with HDIG domain